MERNQIALLPDEVLLQILSHIHRRSHLVELARVSKHFKTLVERLLYHHISLDIRYSAKELNNTRLVNKFSHTTIPSFVPFDRLIEHLSVRQDLGNRVRALDLRVHRGLWYMPLAAHSRLLELLPELRALSLSPPPLDLSIPCSDWGVKSLRLDFGYVTDHYVGAGDWLHIGVPLQIVARYLRLARVRKIQVEKAFFTSQFDEARHLPIGSSSVDDIRFLNCCERKSDRVLASFVRSIKYLKRFVVEFSSLTYQAAPPGRDTGAFKSALSGHQETIEELVVATSGEPASIRWALGPFTQWASLKRLAVPSYMVIENFPSRQKLHEILPPLLEEFQIEHPTAHIHRPPMRMLYSSPVFRPKLRPGYDRPKDAARADDLADMRLLALNKNDYVHRLNTVIWWYQVPEKSSPDYIDISPDSTLAELIRIFLAFEEVGVKFLWVTESLFKDTPFGKRLCEWQE